MAGDTTDGCLNSKMMPPDAEDMEVGSSGGHEESQDSQHEVAPSSQLAQSQPATQPLDESIGMETASQGLEDGVWGQLYPHCGTFPRIALKQDNFRFGRASMCDYVIKESDMGDLKWLTTVSKVQCEIIKNSNGIFLKDKSSNGTWVNGHKIGKDAMWPLDHNAEICFAGAKKKVYVFMSTEPQTETFPTALTNKYTVSKVLGRGATGEVRLGFRIPDLHRVAIKIISKKNCSTISSLVSSQEAILNEVRILQNASHPNIIHLEDVIDSKDFLFIVLELAEGGELFDKIIEKTKFNEAEAKLHFYQMASAINYLHSKNICHRDLKPENILLCSLDDKNPVIKITDMGLSKLVDLNTVMKTFCGTPQYIAPEIVLGAGRMESQPYSMKVDVWSLGVILYILVSGTPPFSEDRKCGMELKQQILQANYIYYPQLFDQISSQAKDLIDKCLRVDPNERISSEEILRHPWLKDDEVLRKAKGLMATQTRGRKRLLEEVEEDTLDSIDGKKPKNEVFKPPLKFGGIYNPPPVDV